MPLYTPYSIICEPKASIEGVLGGYLGFLGRKAYLCGRDIID